MMTTCLRMRKSFLYLVASAVLFSGTAKAELFEFTGVSDGGQWNGAVDALDNSGLYTFQGTGGIQELNDQLSMFVNGPGVDMVDINPIASTSQIVDVATSTTQTFTVNSLDWRAVGANGGNTASLVGYLGTTEQWRISGPQETDPPVNFTTPTTGSFGNTIDTITWDIPDYVDNTFGHQLDNVDVTFGPVAGLETFAFTGVSDGGQWNGAVDSPSDSGNYTYTGSGFIQELGDKLEMFSDDGGIPNTTITPIQSTAQVLDAVSDQAKTFQVFSVDWRAGSGNGGATASLVGYSGGAGGTEVWRINGPQDLSPGTTFIAPTTGSFGIDIDTVVWDIPDYGDGVFQHEFDNLQVFVTGDVAPPAGQETFTFTGVSDGGQWDGAVDALSNSGDFTFTGSGGIQELNDQLSMFVQDDLIPDNDPNPIQSVSQVLDATDDTVKTFNVESVDWRAGAGNGGATAALIGMIGGPNGTEVWRLEGPENLTPPATFTSPTSGDWTLDIDTLIWDIPDYLDGVFQHELDNFVINITGDAVTTDPADLNMDGFVDGLDLGILLGNWNQNVGPSGGELNGIQPVDGLDLGILLGAWNPPPAAAAAVPEPTSLMLLGLGGVVLASSRRRK